MSRGVLFVIIGLVVVALIAAIVMSTLMSGLGTRQPPRTLDSELNPSPSGQPAPVSPPPTIPTPLSVEEIPEPPAVDAVTGPWGRNPFLTLDEIDLLRNPRKFEIEPEPPAVRLTTILTVNGKRMAALNGHYVTTGDYLLSEKVIQITRYSLTLQREDGKTREIKLHEPLVSLKSRSRP